MSKYTIGKGSVHISVYHDFILEYNYDNAYNQYSFSLKNNFTYRNEAGSSALGNITRIENIYANITAKFEDKKAITSLMLNFL